jgi:hypothetical protein
MLCPVADGPAELMVADAAGWRDWLAANVGLEAGVWLVLAKKGTTTPASLTYDEALVGRRETPRASNA